MFDIITTYKKIVTVSSIEHLNIKFKTVLT